MQVRVVERWVDAPGRAEEAREYLYSLIRYLAIRRLLGGDEELGGKGRGQGKGGLL